MPIPLRHAFRWLGALAFAALALPLVFVSVMGWNWLRGPIERAVEAKTGRHLSIRGELVLLPAWPLPRVRASQVAFANPSWALRPSMVEAATVEISIDLAQLLQGKLMLPTVSLERPVVFLENGAGGRKNWLLDREQRDENVRVLIGRLLLDRGTLGYDDAVQRTSVLASVSTVNAPSPDAAVEWTATGQFKAMDLHAKGSGGPILLLRDLSSPYPVTAHIVVGPTTIDVDGSISGLAALSAVDTKVAFRGGSLEQLYPLLGVAFPQTRAYATQGRLLRRAGTWRYESFSGRIGASDIAGWLEVATGSSHPILKADLASRILDIADLGPLIGARSGAKSQTKAAVSGDNSATRSAIARVLPEIPFNVDRWPGIEADVALRAKSLIHPQKWPLDNLVAQLHLHDAVLRIEPLDFGVAGGHMSGAIVLDSRQVPIAATVKGRARNLRIAQLLPDVGAGPAGIGILNGEFNLAGRGNSVGRMLGSADGKLAFVTTGGGISRLMMERAGLHLWEIFEIKLSGDRIIKVRCGVAEFGVKHGLMQASALVLDTEITTISGTGSIDLDHEELDLTLIPKTKSTSPLALRSPLHVHGSFSKPVFEVDKARVATRALGALALAFVNPLLALIPLIDAGPGSDSDCRALVREAKGLAPTASSVGRTEKQDKQR